MLLSKVTFRKQNKHPGEIMTLVERIAFIIDFNKVRTSSSVSYLLNNGKVTEAHLEEHLLTHRDG